MLLGASTIAPLSDAPFLRCCLKARTHALLGRCGYDILDTNLSAARNHHAVCDVSIAWLAATRKFSVLALLEVSCHETRRRTTARVGLHGEVRVSLAPVVVKRTSAIKGDWMSATNRIVIQHYLGRRVHPTGHRLCRHALGLARGHLPREPQLASSVPSPSS